MKQKYYTAMIQVSEKAKDKILEIKACIESPTYLEQKLGFYYKVQVPIFYETYDKTIVEQDSLK